MIFNAITNNNLTSIPVKALMNSRIHSAIRLLPWWYYLPTLQLAKSAPQAASSLSQLLIGGGWSRSSSSGTGSRHTARRWAVAIINPFISWPVNLGELLNVTVSTELSQFPICNWPALHSTAQSGNAPQKSECNGTKTLPRHCANHAHICWETFVINISSQIHLHPEQWWLRRSPPLICLWCPWCDQKPGQGNWSWSKIADGFKGLAPRTVLCQPFVKPKSLD